MHGSLQVRNLLLHKKMYCRLTEEYIAKIFIEEPKRALQLLDEAENLNCMPSNMINDLRSRTYRNMYMNKSAFVYARKAYVIDSIQGTDPSHLLEMTIDLAEISFSVIPSPI